MTSQILTIRRIVEGVRAKNLEATILFDDVSPEAILVLPKYVVNFGFYVVV